MLSALTSWNKRSTLFTSLHDRQVPHAVHAHLLKQTEHTVYESPWQTSASCCPHSPPETNGADCLRVYVTDECCPHSPPETNGAYCLRVSMTDECLMLSALTSWNKRSRLFTSLCDRRVPHAVHAHLLKQTEHTVYESPWQTSASCCPRSPPETNGADCLRVYVTDECLMLSALTSWNKRSTLFTSLHDRQVPHAVRAHLLKQTEHTVYESPWQTSASCCPRSPPKTNGAYCLRVSMTDECLMLSALTSWNKRSRLFTSLCDRRVLSALTSWNKRSILFTSLHDRRVPHAVRTHLLKQTEQTVYESMWQTSASCCPRSPPKTNGAYCLRVSMTDECLMLSALTSWNKRSRLFTSLCDRRVSHAVHAHLLKQTEHTVYESPWKVSASCCPRSPPETNGADCLRVYVTDECLMLSTLTS